MSDPNIVILAAGKASRMKRSADSAAAVHDLHRAEAVSKPKAMMTVGHDGRPFLDYLLRNVERSGYRIVVLVVAEQDTTIRDYYDRENHAAEFPRLTMSYVPQLIPSGHVKPAGTADALLQALGATPSLKGRKFTVCNSDNLYSPTALKLLLEDTHENASIHYDRAALLFSAERVNQFAILTTNGHGFLTSIIEKPAASETEQLLHREGRIGVSMNIWRFSSDDILPFLKQVPLHPVRKEKELPVAVHMMVTEGHRNVFAIPLSEHVPDLTSLDDIPSVQEYLQTVVNSF